MFVCCECCVLSGRCLYDEVINHPEISNRTFRVYCVIKDTFGRESLGQRRDAEQGNII
jgi:hypothetical protein